MAKDNVQVLDKLFSKGLLKNLGENKTADYYADVMVNLRIKNGGITPRKGTKTVYVENNTLPVQGTTSNEVSNQLLVVQNSILKRVNIGSNPVTSTDIGSVSYSGKVRFLNYGKYTIILTGSGYPRVYDGTTLSQLTSTNIAVNTNPSFGKKYAGFTIVNNNLNKNTIRVSRPISLANQQYAYDWVGTGSETLSFGGEVLALESTLQFLWIFTSESIEYISRDNLTTTGGIASLFSIPIASGDKVMNADCVESANEFIFYLTNGKRIKTINYVQGNPNPQVAVISNDIDEYMQTKLHDDQSKAFCMYDKQENLVKFYVRSKSSTVNDVCICYDMENQTFFFDMDKYYIGVTELVDKYYAGSSYIYRVVQDEIGTDDDNYPVNWRYETSKMTQGNPIIQKQYRGARLAGRINLYTNFTRQYLVDNKLVMSKNINISSIPGNAGFAGLGIGGASTGGDAIGGDIAQEAEELADFDKEANHGAIRDTGKRARIVLFGGSKQQKLVIDYADVTYRVMRRADRGSVV